MVAAHMPDDIQLIQPSLGAQLLNEMHLWDQQDILQVQHLNTHALFPHSISSVLPSAILFLLNTCAIVIDNVNSARIRDIKELIAVALQEIPTVSQALLPSRD
jgi:hypothetical protein